MARDVWQPARRFVMASAIVAALIAIVPVSACVLKGVDRVHAQAALFEEGIAACDQDEKSGAVSSASEEGVLKFDQEVLSIEGLDGFQANDDCSVVGFSVEGRAADAFLELSEKLMKRGWVQVESGSDCAGSFVKQEGELYWIFVNCVGFDGETSVVMCVR